MKKALSIIPILIIIGILLSACTENLRKNKVVEEDTYEERYDVIDKGPVKGGSVTLFTPTIDTLNPIITDNIYVQDFLGLVFEGLYRLDETQKPVPILAESSSFSADGLVVTIKLKDNIKWHDTMPFKADDVIFTINTIMDSKNNSVYVKNVQNILSVAAGNNNTVIINLKQPNSFILEELTFPIIPKHYFLNEKVNVKNSKRNLSPIGTGPYIFVSYDSKQGVKLKLNEEWWNNGVEADNSDNRQTKSISLPYISNVDVKIFNNSNEANSAFQTREVDVIPADYNEFRKYIGRTDITMKRYPGKNYEFLSLNIKKGPLANKFLRNAVNNFIDKKKLVDTAASGIAVSAEIPVLPNSWVYQLSDLGQEVEIKKTKELMTQAGYSYNSGKNKYLNKKTRKTLTLKLIVNDDNNLRFNTAKEIAAQLGKNGITVEIDRIPWSDIQQRLKSGSYDMALLGYKISSVPDLSFAYSTAEIASGLNVAGYSNPVVDNYLQQILTQNDPEIRKNTYISLLNTVLDDRPYIGLYFLYESMMYSKNIRGTVNPYIWNKYNDISQWYIPQQ